MLKLLFSGTVMALVCTLSGIAAAANLLPGDTSFEAGPDQWMGGESVARNDAPFGDYVLELSKPHNHSQIYYGLIKSGREYTLSFSARCPQGPTKIKAAILHVHYAAAAGPYNLKLTQQWQRYKLQIKPQKLNRNIYFTITLPPNVKIELDGLMLSEDSTVDYASNPNPVAGQTPTGAPGNILLEQDPIPVIKIGTAAGNAPVNGKLTTKTVDYHGQIRKISDWNVNLKPGESVRFDYPVMEKNSRGYYLIKTELTDAKGKLLATSTQPFGVAPQPVKMTLKKSFFGLHPAGDRITLNALPRIGVKWLRNFYLWRVLERKPGKIKPIKAPEDCDFAILACIKILKGAPKNQLHKNALKNFDAMDKFLTDLVKKSSPQVSAWEIENEPDLGFPSFLKKSYRQAAEYYCKLATSAGAAIKNADPDTKVAILGCSGNATDSFITAAKPKKNKLFDVLTVHPYASARYIGPGMRAVAPDAYLRSKLLNKATMCNGKELWAGEVGWAYDCRVPVDSATTRLFSDYTARALIIMRSIPQVKKVMWFKAQGCYERDYYQYGLWRSEFEPLPAALFYADIASRLDTAKPYKPIFENDIRAYTFVAEDERPFAAVWKYKGDVDELLIPAPADKVKLTDMFGHPVKLSGRGKNTLIPLSSSPAWLEIDDTTPEELVKLLKAIHVNKAPASINVYYRDDNRIAGCLQSNLPQAQDVTLKLGNSNTSQHFSLPPSGIRSFSMPLPNSTGPYQLLVSSSAGAAKYEDLGNYLICPPAPNWKKLLTSSGSIVLKKRRYIFPPDPEIGWESAADQSGRFGWGWDSKYFYFAADITDPVHFQPSTTYRAWNGDSLQLAFDTMNDATEGTFEFNDSDAEFIAWLSPEGAKLAKTFAANDDIGKPVKGSKIEITRKGNITSYRLAIPWSALAELTPLPGRIFGMNFIINQNNGKGRRYWLGLTEGIGEGKYPWLYKRFIIKK